MGRNVVGLSLRELFCNRYIMTRYSGSGRWRKRRRNTEEHNDVAGSGNE